MPDYQKTKIYKIVNDVNKKFYIGHTVNSLSKRIYQHRNEKREENKCMVKNIGVNLNECSIILVENYPCKDVDEARKRERFYIEKYKDEGLEIINKHIPGRTKKEYAQLSIVKIKKKNYYHKTKDKPENIERTKTNSKKHYEKNKLEIQKYRNEKITCECGAICSRGQISIHKKTKKHQVYMFLKDIEQSIFITN